MDKICTKCNLELPFERFRFETRRGKTKPLSICKSCETKKRNAYKKAHKYKPKYNECGEKFCEKCYTFKSLLRFALSPQSPDGYVHTCNLCRYGKEKYTTRQRLERKCMRCKEIKLRENFQTSEEGFLGSICSSCQGTKLKIDHRINRKSTYKKEQRFKKYGLTEESYNQMLEQQINKCGICEKELVRTSELHKNPINIDHCHETGKVRGLLCNTCNTGLGGFKDSVDNLMNAIQYLKNSK